MYKFGIIISIIMISSISIKGYLSSLSNVNKIFSVRNSRKIINKTLSNVIKAAGSSISDDKSEILVANSGDNTVTLDWDSIKSESSRSFRIIFHRIPDGPWNLEVVCNPRVSLRNLVPGSVYNFTISEICGTETTTLKSGLFTTSKISSSLNVPSNALLTDLSRLEIRVGKILEIRKHPEADNLYVESVDVGESTSRTIVSGLVEYCPIESLLNQQVIVLCNLKPRELKGITSYGMLLCSSNSDHTKVEPLKPPAGVGNGQLITFEGHIPEPIEAGNRASKAYTKIVNDLYVDDNGIATYQGIPFMTPLGSCTSSLKGKIS